MKVTSIIDRPEGKFEFTAQLSQAQHQFLIEYAIRDLVSKGLVPFITPESDSDITAIIPDYESLPPQ